MYSKLSLVIVLLISSLISCSRGGKTEIQDISSIDDERYEEFVKGNCIRDDFSQGSDDNVYGLECIDGKQVVIKTSKEGTLVSTSKVPDMKTGLRIEGDVNFKNKFYISESYTILENHGDDKHVPFLLDFLPKDEKFTGALDTEYHIIFKPIGNRLVLFKAVEVTEENENWDDLPDVERTALKIFRNGEVMDYERKSYKNKTGDYYIVPFISYSLKYCKSESLQDINKRDTKISRLNCEDSHLQSGDYAKLELNSKKSPDYLQDLKKDLFLSEYFDGLWYFSESEIESNTSEGEIYNNFRKAWLVMMERGDDLINLRDVSGDVEERIRQVHFKLPVKWLDFEWAQDGNGHWENFVEREKKSSDRVTRPYVQIDFDSLSKLKNNGKLLELIVEPDYFSFIYETSGFGRKSTRKVKSSFYKIQEPSSDCSNKKDEAKCLKVKLADKEKFASRRWFKEDHNHVFGIMDVFPQDALKQGESTETEILDHIRMIKFNTHLMTEDEQKTKTKTIRWHFSKNSTKDPEYRELAEKAVEIYNQAFQHLTKDRDKKIRVELVKEEEKDLGDLRHNIINLVRTENMAHGGSGLLGVAPSNANPDTGQIIGATANIFIHKVEDLIFNKAVRDYIRYEVFQKDKKTDAENKIHAISPYLRSQIQEKCSEVDDFIKAVKSGSGLHPRKELKDRETIISCGKELAKPALLELILHEMGHNFGLAHNFQASSDSENYYETEDEIRAIFPRIDSVKELARSSSVMDYSNSNHLKMEYLGKYDLAALRYLYLDELELEDGTFKRLEIPADPKNQNGLSKNMLQERKKYLHCSHAGLASVMMCDAGDYGSNPKEIVQQRILTIKRALNRFRYRYDALFHAFPGHILEGSLTHLQIYYNKWIELRDHYLKNTGKNFVYNLEDQTAIDKYNIFIEEGLSRGGEYALYYPVRKEISDFMIELADLDEMKCHLTDDSEGAEHVFSLKVIKNQLRDDYGDNLYVEDCQSPQVLDFFAQNNLAFTQQTGYEDFVSYYPQKSRKAKLDVTPISSIVYHTLFAKKTDENNQPIIDVKNAHPLYQFMMEEPDLLRGLYLKLQERVLNPEKNQTFSYIIGLNQTMLSNVQRAIIRNLNENNRKDILKKHIENLNFRIYKTGKGTNSFHEEVAQYLENLEREKLERELSALQIPFLKTAYEEYIQFKSDRPTEYHDLSFQDYLLNRRDVFYDRAGQTFTIPLRKNSFFAQILQKYNEVSDKIKELDEKFQPSAVEKLTVKALRTYLGVLKPQ